ncbi:MAG: hypothetical protein Q4E31_08240 [Intestinibacter bartlettii]|uniref:hypothetical protein n=1 Tax=Intestinibacter bartlettii TaxID=261299 RepID=UPI0026F14BF9|nr:hypothetical protein [Intestinibacter bartlettii]MDO5010799.1 hypothetical protein [Intestinibacter bartlettii]
MNKLILALVIAMSLTVVGCESSKTASEDKTTVKTEQKKEEKKNDTEASKVSDSNDTAKKDENVMKELCYDCGEEKPVKNMYFDGRKYHCGCVGLCYNCGKAVKKEVACYYEGILFCADCYNMPYQDSMTGFMKEMKIDQQEEATDYDWEGHVDWDKYEKQEQDEPTDYDWEGNVDWDKYE